MPTRNLILLGTISKIMFAAASAFATARPAVAAAYASSRHCMHYSRPASFSTQSHLLLGKGRSRSRSSSGAATFSSLRLSSTSMPFQVTSKFEPSGDQPKAIEDLVRGMQEGERFSVLRGATGTGKTFVMGHTIARLNRPTLVLCHNKTLAAQVARELKSFLKSNTVELFVSYYNHYTPESYMESTGTYIAKKSSVNEEIDALRHRATRALLERRDVVIVASVSCIYGLGLPRDYLDASVSISVMDQYGGSGISDISSAGDLTAALDAMLYESEQDGEDDSNMLRGSFDVSVDQAGNEAVTFWPPHEKMPIRVAFDKGGISTIHQSTEGGSLVALDELRIFPARHQLTSHDRLENACAAIEEELSLRVKELNSLGKHVESQRLQQRVMNDLLMLRESGRCQGIENYSRHLAGRKEGEAPDTLLSYMKFAAGEAVNNEEGEQSGDWLLIVDESHVTVPQLRAMYHGDRARKERLIQHGFRLPSALDNRPLREDEFWKEISQAVFVSATPSDQNVEWANERVVDMVIRPTHVIDPKVHVRPKGGQLEDLLREVKQRAERKERVLAVALTKRDAEDLASYFIDHGVRAGYIHSGLNTVERADALKSLQSGDIDCLVGVNLLREGLDLPQVSLVAILNADSEGFLRCQTSLLQTIGRAARNAGGEAILYADRMTKSMEACLRETERRRTKQLEYNLINNVESKSTSSSNMMSIFDLLKDEIAAEKDSSGKSSIGNNKSNNRDEAQNPQPLPQRVDLGETTASGVITDHIPSKPGVYFWKDINGKYLYIGKAKKLRSRVKSYLSPGAKHTLRIKKMLEKAESVEFVLTPSDRDALLLESNLIKQHQPPYNVLLKDDEAYPYICASIGDRYPRFFAVPRRLETAEASKYRYYGPYPNFNEINTVLESIERRYGLRTKSFAARHGSENGVEYKREFENALKEVFETPNSDESCPVLALREQFEEASLLFGSEYNKCRDVVAIERCSSDTTMAIVYLVQLRDGVVSGIFSYSPSLPSMDGQAGDESLALSDVLQTILEKHYASAGDAVAGAHSFFPDEILCDYEVHDSRSLKQSIRKFRRLAEPSRRGAIQIRTPNRRGPRVRSDERAMTFANDNAKQLAVSQGFKDQAGSLETSLDGTAASELRKLLSLERNPRKIECYDISHTQGEGGVASRVVFVDGRPAKHLYRKFNLKTVENGDDYAGLEEVLERRFRRANFAGASQIHPAATGVAGGGNGNDTGNDDAWEHPDLVVIDGGKGQLSAAIKGIQRANAAIPEICAIAKDKEEVFVPGTSHPINGGSPDTPALLLLRHLRDESHRFALKSHRRRRSRSM